MKKIRFLVSGLVLMLVPASLLAQDKPVKTTFSAGVTLNQGNNDTLQANASILTEGARDTFGSFRTGVEGTFGESTVDEVTETTSQNAKLFGNARRMLSDRWFAYGDISLAYDKVALIDYRAIVGPGAGYYLVKKTAVSLSAEAGAAYIWEEVGDIRDDYLAFRAAQRFEYQISETAKLWQSAEYIPQAGDLDNYLVNAEIGVEAALNSHLNLRLVAQQKYDNQPATDRDRNDLTLIAGLSASF
jgi:putative salt-induced outer membrane protein YdiY